MQLVDWGMRRFRKGRRYDHMLSDLLRLFHPSALVLRRVSGHSRRNSPHIARMVSRITKEARATKTPIVYVSERTFARLFQELGDRTKQQIATSMAECFPELAWKLPPPRMPWQPEDARMSLFDAVALGFAHYALKVDPDAAREMHFIAKPFHRLPRGV